MKSFREGLSLVGILHLILALVLLVGILTFCAPCGMHEDGAWSSCHWAGQAIIGLAGLTLLLSLLSLLSRKAWCRFAFSLSACGVSLLTALVPGTLIRLCMMSTMRCITVMKPCVLVLSLLMALLSLVGALQSRKAAKKEETQR